jgi:PAS domain S-box-containing protein
MTADTKLAERRLKLLTELAGRTSSAKDEHDVLSAAVELLSVYAPDLGSDPRFTDLICNQVSGALANVRNASDGFNRRAEEQLLLLVRASSTLLGRPDAPDVLEKILVVAQQFVAADGYALWRRQNDEGLWHAMVLSGLSPAFDAVSWETGQRRPMAEEAIAYEDVFGHELLSLRWEGYRIEGIRSLLSVPLRIHGEVTGTVVFYYRTQRGFSPSDKNLATSVGNLAAAAIEISELYGAQEKLRKDAEDGRRRAQFLASAGALLASSLDVDATLNAIADLAVPAIADWCTIDLADAEGILRRVSVRHADPARMLLARSLFERYPILPESPLYTVLNTGRSFLTEEMPESLLRAGARSEEHYEALLAAGLKSAIFAPLWVHGEKLGILSVFTAESGRRYSRRDLELVEDLASRAAFAVRSARLHQEARESAERLRISAAAAGLGIFEWNLDTGVIVWENPRIYEIFGRDPQHGPPRGPEFLRDIVHPDDRRQVESTLESAANPGTSVQTVFRIRRLDGAVRTVELAGRCDTSTGPGMRRLLGVIADITERRLLEARLREAAKLESIGVLAGGVAHDFNNLLTGVMGHSSLALETIDADHPAFEMIQNVLAASERAAALTRQLLAYSGRGKFVLESVDLSDLIREITALVRMSTPKNAEIVLELADGLPEIQCDPTQMQQLAMNLVINAAEALEDEPGTVVVTTGATSLSPSETERLRGNFELRPGRYVWLEVRDNGCGMSEETSKKIFDPFFSTKFTGRGLGLSAVQGIVRGHKGALEVQSAPGRGTTFRVFIPAKHQSESTIIEV